jgi:hypothetical protein
VQAFISLVFFLLGDIVKRFLLAVLLFSMTSLNAQVEQGVIEDGVKNDKNAQKIATDQKDQEQEIVEQLEEVVKVVKSAEESGLSREQILDVASAFVEENNKVFSRKNSLRRDVLMFCIGATAATSTLCLGLLLKKKFFDNKSSDKGPEPSNQKPSDDNTKEGE